MSPVAVPVGASWMSATLQVVYLPDYAKRKVVLCREGGFWISKSFWIPMHVIVALCQRKYDLAKYALHVLFLTNSRVGESLINNSAHSTRWQHYLRERSKAFAWHGGERVQLNRTQPRSRIGPNLYIATQLIVGDFLWSEHNSRTYFRFFLSFNCSCRIDTPMPCTIVHDLECFRGLLN